MKNRLVPKRDDLDLGLEVVSRSFQPLRHIRDRSLVPKDHQ